MRRTVVACWILMGLTVGVFALHADTIAVYSTGVDSTGVLADGAVDPYYVLVANADNSGPNAYVVIENQFPIPPWVADDSLSKWIAPVANESSQSDAVGLYDYQTTFDLTGLIPSTAVISGLWTSDNEGDYISLNGVNLGYATAGDFSTLGYSFTIAGGFVWGINTLDFVATNDSGNSGNPTGLRVQLSGTADPVPEPATWGLVGLGLLGAGLLRRRANRRP